MVTADIPRICRPANGSAPNAGEVLDHLPEPPPVLGTRGHSLITLGLVALVIYASLFPFALEGRSFAEALDRFEKGCQHTPIELGDFIANILLFIPLGYFLLGALRVDRAGGSLLATMAALVSACALSVSVEFLQAFFPPRTPCLNDILAQVLGACLGVTAWQCAGRLLTARIRGVWMSHDLRPHAGSLLLAYVVLALAAVLLPFHLELQFEALGQRFGSAVSRAAAFEFVDTTAYVWSAVLLLPAGVLAAFVTRRAGRVGEERRALLYGIVVVALISLAGLMARGKMFDLFTVPVALLAFAAGWLQGRAMRRCWHRAAIGTAPMSVVMLVGVGIAWFAAASRLLHGQPLDFTDDPSLLSERARAMNWLPLYEIYGKDYLLILQTALQQSALFLIGGGLLALAARKHLGRGAAVPAAAIAFAIALLFEAGQVTPPELAPSVTAVLSQTLAAWVGFLAVRDLLPREGMARLPIRIAPRVEVEHVELTPAPARTLQPV